MTVHQSTMPQPLFVGYRTRNDDKYQRTKDQIKNMVCRGIFAIPKTTPTVNAKLEYSASDDSDDKVNHSIIKIEEEDDDDRYNYILDAPVNDNEESEDESLFPMLAAYKKAKAEKLQSREAIEIKDKSTISKGSSLTVVSYVTKKKINLDDNYEYDYHESDNDYEEDDIDFDDGFDEFDILKKGTKKVKGTKKNSAVAKFKHKTLTPKKTKKKCFFPVPNPNPKLLKRSVKIHWKAILENRIYTSSMRRIKKKFPLLVSVKMKHFINVVIPHLIPNNVRFNGIFEKYQHVDRWEYSSTKSSDSDTIPFRWCSEHGDFFTSFIKRTRFKNYITETEWFCPYCPFNESLGIDYNFFATKNSAYTQHMTTFHGIFASNIQIPPPLIYSYGNDNFALCAECGEGIKLKKMTVSQNILSIYYYHHFRRHYKKISQVKNSGKINCII